MGREREGVRELKREERKGERNGEREREGQVVRAREREERGWKREKESPVGSRLQIQMGLVIEFHVKVPSDKK